MEPKTFFDAARFPQRRAFLATLTPPALWDFAVGCTAFVNRRHGRPQLAPAHTLHAWRSAGLIDPDAELRALVAGTTPAALEVAA